MMRQDKGIKEATNTQLQQVDSGARTTNKKVSALSVEGEGKSVSAVFHAPTEDPAGDLNSLVTDPAPAGGLATAVGGVGREGRAAEKEVKEEEGDDRDEVGAWASRTAMCLTGCQEMALRGGWSKSRVSGCEANEYCASIAQRTSRGGQPSRFG